MVFLPVEDAGRGEAVRDPGEHSAQRVPRRPGVQFNRLFKGNLNLHLNHRHIRRLSNDIFNPCLNFCPYSGLRFQMSIELTPQRLALEGGINNCDLTIQNVRRDGGVVAHRPDTCPLKIQCGLVL